MAKSLKGEHLRLMRLALAPKVAVVEEDMVVVAEEDMVVAEKDKVVGDTPIK
jgi:hypothetical protein